ncbi:pilus assembly protein [Tepidanaerobacter sp. GT38]|uniref:TadE/TadG family type IV pilus assembly protein n=1 Tax=Tepidanaerobacter sp. GT38 TaxID=2722793 RepID=UPI001F33FFB6|nr:TadE family protein [Tepidanaerobacter sp. GT38]MCG1011539.1 pilus assembly protein [Tepidanaerobacter sp. GT38]
MMIRKFVKTERGQTLVELALVLPIIILILFGTLEFGRIFHSYIVITNAAREGARLGALGKSDEEIISRIREASPLYQADTRLRIIRLEPNESARNSGVPLTVEVAYDVELVTPIISSILPNPVTLKSTAVMRVE